MILYYEENEEEIDKKFDQDISSDDQFSDSDNDQIIAEQLK